MASKEIIESITFSKTANIFVNIGIVGFYRFLKKYEIDHPRDFPSLEFELHRDRINVKCEKLIKLLEEVYYFMGEQVYDTWTSEQLKNARQGIDCNLFYSEEDGSFHPFPKIKSYGLPELFTNGRPKNTRDKENQSRISKLKTENPGLAQKFVEEFKKREIKLQSVIYFNERYTTIPRLDLPNTDYLNEALDSNNVCALTGKAYKKIFDANNNSAFIKKQGIHNFKSFFNNRSYGISWKAMYLIRFAPALCFYTYRNKYETIICNFFNSDSLLNIDKLHDTSLFLQKEVLQENKYLINFQLASFSVPKKGDEELKIETTRDAVWESEIAFMLLYTFYQDKFWKEMPEETKDSPDYVDPFAGHPLEKTPISLVTFRADKFASTLRPNSFEEYNNVKFVLQLIFALSKELSIGTLWQSLKLKSPKAQVIEKQDPGKGRAVERQIRAAVLEKVLKGKSVLPEIEDLFFKSYKYLLAKEQTGYRDYFVLENFLMLYEKAINFGNNKLMNEELQQRAIKLGRSLSYGIINHENPKDEKNKQVNARNGRKYIIRLHKARTLEQFTEALISIMKKYGTSVSNEILENLSKDNFILVRQYTVIGALNGLNRILSPYKNDN